MSSSQCVGLITGGTLQRWDLMYWTGDWTVGDTMSHVLSPGGSTEQLRPGGVIFTLLVITENEMGHRRLLLGGERKMRVSWASWGN